MCPGMIPILALAGEMSPGQLGPMSRLGVRERNALTLTMSVTGTPSVMQTMRRTPAAAASMMASAAAGGGTKISAQSAPAASTASSTVFHTGNPSWVVPPLPGVTPPTMRVPYSLHRAAWNAPSFPVIPCTITRVDAPTRMLIALTAVGVEWPRSRRASCERDGLPRAVAHVVGVGQVQAGFREHLAPQLDVRAFHADDHRQPQTERLDGGDHAFGQTIAAQDAAEHVDEHRL